jgi:hypothetical protein
MNDKTFEVFKVVVRLQSFGVMMSYDFLGG